MQSEAALCRANHGKVGAFALENDHPIHVFAALLRSKSGSKGLCIPELFFGMNSDSHIFEACMDSSSVAVFSGSVPPRRPRPMIAQDITPWTPAVLVVTLWRMMAGAPSLDPAPVRLNRSRD